jgi:CheY-like chemotaxis protein
VEVRSNCKNVIDDINLVKPDVILMDLWIPEIGGELTIPIIKANADTKHIPVVIFSANSQLKEICKKIKADGYLEKPFDISLLKETVDKFIRKI